ncbi:MAG: hypothetical protein EAZ70_09025 [Runella slithyformis]|nr:MAG: hypothetical protein EAY79_09865 [Runella slithyformis]TAF92946.1 MAG: hypothetical protein EAZ46_12915 [Runella sp.]TAG23177.1 MAG: hypothetical protein EAZ38_03680 [Cytophagales bacterium]TAG42414.1 MAG: hypothetical protein EAZ32_01150 [Cytophagia bacterium]TAE97053.1 MAG: hypothetical protein EAZ80_07805 [Runella slithyformis]
MKTKLIISTFCFFFASLAAFAQTTLPGKQEIDKTTFEGLYVTTKIDDKYLEKYWETYLKQYGKVSSSRGSVYRASGVSIPSISADPLNLASKVSSSKGISQVFIYIDLGNGSYVTQGTKGYAEAETFLKRFADDAILYDASRMAEEAMKDTEKSFNKLTRKGEGLKKDIEKTEKELANLKKDLEINQKDVATGQTDLETKKKAFDDAKAKIPAKN